MEIRPILSALLRSKVAMVLIGLQIALTLAIVCNALFIISGRFEKMRQPSGMDEVNTFTITSDGFGANFDGQNTATEDLMLLRGLPGVAAASLVDSLPLNGLGIAIDVALISDPQAPPVTQTVAYFVDENGLNAMGKQVVEGRGFKSDEFTWRQGMDGTWPYSIIITRALAEKLFPGQNAIGKQIYFDAPNPPQTIVGLIEKLQGYSSDLPFNEHVAVLPQRYLTGNVSKYLIRAAPGRRDELMKQIETRLLQANPSRILRALESFETVRNRNYRNDKAMAIILGVVIVALLIITALGIVGMSSFWVAQRTRQIGTRRALGATRLDILRYFLTENFVITTAGLLLGVVLTYGLNLWLMGHYQVHRLPWFYVPVGLICLWALGQLAVLGPATRAARVSPVVATRSV